MPSFTSYRWQSKIFDLLSDNNTAKSAIYSIAFHLTFYHFQLNQKTSAESEDLKKSFLQIRELFDLLDDLMNGVGLSERELLKSRLVSFQDMMDVKNRGKNLDERKIWLEIGDEFMEYVKNNTSKYATRKVSAMADENFLMNNIQPFPARIHLMESVLKKLQYYHDNSIPLMDNLLGTKSYDDPIDPEEEKSDFEGFSRFSPFRRFLDYYPSLETYELLREIMDRINESRGIDLFPILLPVPLVWQGPTSKLLWILLHTIMALCRAQNNAYTRRCVYLLIHLRMFILCLSCEQNWADNRGGEYFTYFKTLPKEILYKVPIDILLLKIHNKIATHSHFASLLQINEFYNVYLDYKEFVEINLLKRNPLYNYERTLNPTNAREEIGKQLDQCPLLGVFAEILDSKK